MGSKGSNQVQQSQSQSYTPSPAVYGAGTQAISMAQNAASQPFQMPVAPVAGFTPFQEQSFGQVQGSQGMSLPYFGTGVDYLQRSAAPVTDADVANYYNPYAASVTAGMEDIFGKQMRQATGKATGMAGGIGADRIAVAQSELARQQGLAAGQTYSNIYQQALQAAQANKQMQANAGFGIAQMGPAAQASYLQGTSALAGAGEQQRQLAQAFMNAPYQNQLARIAYPFQTAQFLAGITGGLAPGMGGYTSGNSTTTYPTPSALQQIIGAGMAGVGLMGASGWLGSDSGSGAPTGSGSWDMSPGQAGWSNMGTGQTSYPVFYTGGAIGYDDGGAVDWPSSSFPTSPATSPIPYIPLNPQPINRPQLDMKAPQQQQSGSGSSDTLGNIANVAMKVLPFFLERGGPVYGYDDGGEIEGESWTPPPVGGRRMAAPTEDWEPSPDYSGESAYGYQGQNWAGGRRMAPPPEQLTWGPPTGGRRTAPPVYPSAFDPGTGPFQNMPTSAPSLPQAPVATAPQAPPQAPAPPAPVTPPVAAPAPGFAGRMRPSDYASSGFQPPYPEARKLDWGQRMARSPWMSLVDAGASIASTPGPIGTVLARGIQAGAGSLQKQRQELRSEESINQKAQQLYNQAQQHLMQYSRKTPHQAATEAIGWAKLNQERHVPGTYYDADGNPHYGTFDQKSGILYDQEKRRVMNSTGFTPARAQSNIVELTDNQAWSKAIQLSGSSDPKYAGRPVDDIVRQIKPTYGMRATQMTPGAGGLKPVPKDKSELVVGVPYSTARGPAVWTGDQFLPIKQ